ncbi:MAG TPA: STAS domain-containing protein [Caulobacterales bacterium]|nr:STAS domain-containing protein [Caulobacterales bacterium]
MLLPQILNVEAAPALWAELGRARGAPLELDASEVDRLGAPCLQVLLAAANAWAESGLPLRIIRASPAFREAVRVMGAELMLPLSEGE